MEDTLQLVRDYEIIGLGEATHGNLKNSQFRVDIIKNLIEHHDVREVFFEAEVFRMKFLNNLSGGPLHAAMNKLQWIFDNRCTRELCEFIFEFNKRTADKVLICGVDIQSYNTENDISDDSALGKAFKKWGKYVKETSIESFPRNKAMAKMFEEQHRRKAVLLFHNFHLNKSSKFKDMGYYIDKKYKNKYICVANTFTRGIYHGFFMSNKKKEFQDVAIEIADPIYEKDGLYVPPPPYLFEGSLQVDKLRPMKYFVKQDTDGFDAVLCINNERPLVPYSKNAGVQYFKQMYAS
jgi:erythromycin esterase-like protein